MGPHVMAGLTHDTARVRLAANDAPNLASLPDDIGYVSMFGLNDDALDICNASNGSCSATKAYLATIGGRGQFLMHESRHVKATSVISNSGEGNDATFRITTPYQRYVPFGIASNK